ncbi:TPA: oligosaccharide repeat unit polymerase [Klebsiella pneumoniae]|uniref:O-antigen polymerase n=1 Tax=Klebsiella pneumoniae TaxID=573 RepID=UPI000E2D0259|nr:O-antigen polymerase [Klebsiella pneumoniae]MCI7873977.1 oligosaccharide repeat unit polymerase [Klebsiella pneumoniae]MCI7905354.1 oligosaccharide repeat unit polymerase [Klebsiella pneumoniae]MEE2284127.1 O-antigen ligase [Klebsiella pneumoniae]MEE3764913.1 O-antigen polymerase [Klebsiella pneumoniae]SWU65539.1 Uncharacterised protein [Klebsiella pneumoniae]
MKLVFNKKSVANTTFRAIALLIYLIISMLWMPDSQILLGYMSFYVLFDLVFLSRFNYLNSSVAFSIPWLLIFAFCAMNLSSFTKQISLTTVNICAIAIFIFNIFSEAGKRSGNKNLLPENLDGSWMKIYFTLFMIMVIINIALAGYIPAIKMVMTGDSGYKTFGISGVYGLFLAFSNAFGVLCFYSYITTGIKKYLFYYITILLVFALFVTRQNIISLAIETIFVYSCVRKRISNVKLLIIFSCVLFLFSVIGGLRSGNIKAIAQIKNEYLWIPDSIIWLYSYCYFNILNLDNLVNLPQVPMYDLSSLSNFIPAILRPKNEGVYFLEVINFNVSSYMSSLYKDMGAIWVWFFTFIVSFYAGIRSRKMNKNKYFLTIAICSVLYFCAFFSFFVNFWTYLPVIFQIFFMFVFSKTAIKIKRII